jgi:PmbA protein
MVKKFTENLISLCDAFEMFKASGKSTSVSFENDRLTEIRQAQSAGTSIRAVKGGKIGFSYSSKPDEVDSVAAAAIRMAPYGKPFNFAFAPKQKSKHTRPYDERCADLNVEKLVGIAIKVKDAVKKIAPEAMAECSLSGGISNTRIETSAGQDCSEEESSFSFAVAAKITEEGNFLSTYRYRSGNELIDEEEILNEAKGAAEDFLLARKIAPVKAGKFRVLFSPDALIDILMPIGVSINGLNIEKKTSRWVDSLGEKLFDERLTLVDDPFHEEGPSGGLYDGEGMCTQKRALIEKGVLKGFLHTLSTAKACGHEPTGNAQRGVSSVPSPGNHNIVMAPGDATLAKLMKDAEGGLYIDQMLGTFTSNFLAGQVSGNVSLGYAIKGGERIGRVKNCALNVNTFDLLKSHIVGISKDRKWVGSAYLPYVLVEDVAISAR